jgi:hypothetical protein
MITIAIDRPEHTKIQLVEVTSDSQVAADLILSGTDLDAVEATSDDLTPSAEAQSDGSTTVVMQVGEVEWTSSLEKEFGQFADLAIYHKLTAKDKSRFAFLTMLRRRLHHPRSAAEILYEEERTEALVDLTNALSRCVKFINAKG